MIDLCRRAPSSEEKLLNIQGLPRPIRVSHGAMIVDAITRGAQTPAQSVAELRKTDELPRQQFQTDAIHALAQALCLARGVDPQLAITRGDTGELLSRLRRGQTFDDLPPDAGLAARAGGPDAFEPLYKRRRAWCGSSRSAAHRYAPAGVAVIVRSPQPATKGVACADL